MVVIPIMVVVSLLVLISYFRGNYFDDYFELAATIC